MGYMNDANLYKLMSSLHVVREVLVELKPDQL